MQEGPATKQDVSTLEERCQRRRELLVGHRARSFDEAEAWDLDFWQSQTPAARLSALVAIRREVEMVETARKTDGRGAP